MARRDYYRPTPAGNPQEVDERREFFNDQWEKYGNMTEKARSAPNDSDDPDDDGDTAESE